MGSEDRDSGNGFFGAALMFGLGVVDFFDSKSWFGALFAALGMALLVSMFLLARKSD